MTIAAGAKLDLSNNSLTISYTGASPAGTIRSLLASGFNAGAWSGAGIDSSTAALNSSSLTALGYRDTGSSVMVKYTYYGDNKLDGKVDTTDFQMFLDGFVATSGSSWSSGDYTYDGKVDLGNDFNLFLRAYLLQGKALGDLAPVVASDSELSAAQRAQLMSLVPEPVPTMVWSSALAAVGARRRRRSESVMSALV
jgi:hypothetical protein